MRQEFGTSAITPNKQAPESQHFVHIITLNHISRKLDLIIDFYLLFFLSPYRRRGGERCHYPRHSPWCILKVRHDELARQLCYREKPLSMILKEIIHSPERGEEGGRKCIKGAKYAKIKQCLLLVGVPLSSQHRQKQFCSWRHCVIVHIQIHGDNIQTDNKSKSLKLATQNSKNWQDNSSQ